MKKIIAILCLLIIISSCSSSKKSNNTIDGPKPVTNKQAQILSRVLYNNKQLKTASFTITSGPFPGNGYKAKGTIDWENGLVKISVYLTTEEHPDIIAIIDLGASQVYESYFGLTTVIDNLKLEPKAWVQRSADPNKFGIDSLAQFLNKLSSDSPDNPLLIKQSGAKYFGKENIGKVKVDKYQLSGSVTYYLTNKGDLKKVSARIKGFDFDADFFFSYKKNIKIELPESQNIYNIEDLGDEYLKNRPAF